MAKVDDMIQELKREIIEKAKYIIKIEDDSDTDENADDSPYIPK